MSHTPIHKGHSAPHIRGLTRVPARPRSHVLWSVGSQSQALMAGSSDLGADKGTCEPKHTGPVAVSGPPTSTTPPVLAEAPLHYEMRQQPFLGSSGSAVMAAGMALPTSSKNSTICRGSTYVWVSHQAAELKSHEVRKVS